MTFVQAPVLVLKGVYTYAHHVRAPGRTSLRSRRLPGTGLSNIYFGFNGLRSVSPTKRRHGNGSQSWFPDTLIFRSTNYDVTRPTYGTWTTYPEFGYQIVYPQDITWRRGSVSGIGGLQSGGRPGPVENPKIG